MVNDPDYPNRRQRRMEKLHIDEVDAPITSLIENLCDFNFCYTIQSCFGHFLYVGQENPKHIGPLPSAGQITSVKYRIGYMAFCIENSRLGYEFMHLLQQIPEIDPNYIQLGCAEWFWERDRNSYVLQVEPVCYKQSDHCTVDLKEAHHIEKVRNKFYDHLITMVSTINLPSSG